MAKSKNPSKGIQRGVRNVNATLSSLQSVLIEQSEQLQKITETSAVVQDEQSGGGTSQLLALQIAKAQLDLQKESNLYLRKLNDGQAKQILKLEEGFKDWKTFSDKFKDTKRAISDAFNIDTIKKKLLGPFTMFKGAREKIEDIDYSKRQKELGTTRTTAELKEDAAKRREFRKEALKAEEELKRLRGLGMSDSDIKQTSKGAELYDTRNKNLADYNKYNIGIGVRPTTPAGNFTGDQTSAGLVQLPSDKGAVPQSTTDVLAEQQVSKENQLESIRILNDQTDLLRQIAANTAGKRDNSAAGGVEDNGDSGGMVGDFSKSLKGIGSALGGIGKGVGLAVGGTIGGIFTGIMMGIADGIKAFGTIKVIKGVAVLGLLTAVVWGMSKALENFQDLEWETLGKAATVIAGLVGAGAAAGAIAPLLGIGALALGGLAASVWAIGEAMKVMGDGLESFTSGLERLSSIDGDALIGVAAGLKELAWAMAGFGAGQAIEGLGNLVSRFLSIGTDSPVEQLIKIGTVGSGVIDAAQGLDRLSETMSKFSKLDPDSMDAINQFPWDKATKFVAAGGSMQVAGAKVYNASKENADKQAVVDGQSNVPQQANVSAAVQNNTTNNQIVKLPARNQESSQAKYLSARY